MYLNTQKYRLFCSLIESLSRIWPACVASVIVSGSPMIAPCKGIWIPKSWKFMFVERWNSGFWNPEYSSRNLKSQNDWNRDSKFHWQRLESSTRNPESTALNPESKAVLEPFTWGESEVLPARPPFSIWAKHSSLHRGLNTHWRDDPARQPRGLLGLLECVVPVL